MGNEKSRQPLDTKLSGTGRWVMVSLAPAETLTYDPKVSYAVCVGVGEQFVLGSNHAGQSANNDAKVIRGVLQDHYGFLEEQMSLLTTDCPDIPTCAAIKKALQRRAGQVSEDGILLFQFSGHCYKKPSGQVYLVPADFTPKVQDSALSIADIAACVKGTKAKHFLVIADCCHAGQIAKSLLQESTGKVYVPTHIVAACSGMQRALYYENFGHGFFTYFISKYLRERRSKEETPEFPIYPLIEYCKPLCQAVAVIISPAMGCDVLMEPEAASFSVSTLEEEDTFRGPRTIRNLRQFRHITRYLSCGSPADCMTRIPDSVDLDWLDLEARRALLTLYKERLLFAPEMYNTMMVFLPQAIAALSHRELKKIDDPPESLLNVDLCVLACLSCADVLASIDKRLVPQLQHVMTWVQFYIIKVKDLLELDIKSEELRNLMTLLSKVDSDIQKFKDSNFRPSESDSDDGEKEGTPEEEEEKAEQEEKTEEEKVQMLYEKLESLSALTDLPHIPQLEEIGTE